MPEALELFVRSMNEARADDDPARGAVVMTNFGSLWLDLGEYEHAHTALEPALAVHRGYGDRIGEQRTLLALCGAYSGLFRHREALDCGRRAVRLGEVMNDQVGLAAAHNQLGDAALRAGRLSEALDHVQAAEANYREHGPARDLAAALNNLGGVLHGLGRLAEAEAALREALPLHRADRDVDAQVTALNTLGWVLRDLGQPEQALLELRDAGRLARESGKPMLIGAAAQHLGEVYLSLDRVDDAVEELRVAHRAAESIGDTGTVGAAANSLAHALLAAGRPAAAVAAARQAAVSAAEAALPAAEASARINLAMAELQHGDVEAATVAAARALELAVAVGDERSQAVAISVAAGIRLAAADPAGAADLLTAAASRLERLGADLEAAAAVALLAEAHRDLGRIDEAVAGFEHAMATVESIRAGVLDEDLRALFFSSTIDIPQRYARLLVGANRPADALRVVERGRARVLADRMAELNGPVRDIDPRIAERRAALHAELLVVERELAHLLRAAAVDPAELAAVRDRRRSLVLELRTNTAALRSTRPRLAELLDPQVPDSTQLHSVLGDAALVEYVLGEQESLLIAATADGVEAYVLPARAVIERMVSELRAAVRTDQPSYPHGHTLYRLLIEPAGTLIGDRDLVVVTDGGLHDLPFGLLLTREVVDPAPEYRRLPYLIRERGLSQLPSITVAGLIGGRSAFGFDRQFVALGDPVSPEAPKLPFTRREIWRIARLFDPDLPADQPEAYDGPTTVIRTGAAATKTEIQRLTTGPDAMRCRYLHLATHGHLDPVRPEFSGLLFSTCDGLPTPDPTWRGYEVLDAQLAGTLVVLSACETALGRALAGEGVLGLGRSFIYAGASAVIASLWPVPDASTSQFMEHLYRRLVDGDPPAVALRQAQLAMLDVASRPRQWAGFITVGTPR